MKFLMVSEYGAGAHVLKMIQNEGNDVQLYVALPDFKKVWDGLLPKVKKVAPSSDTTVIFDFSGMGAMADKLRKAGHFVVGASKFADRLEQDRQFGFDVMAESGIKVPLTQEFTKFSDIGDFLGANGSSEDGAERRFVFKPSGKMLPSHLTYCSLDNDDLVEYAAYVEKNYGKDIDSFVLQEFVCGTVISTELWCDGSKFVRPTIHDIEVKAFMDGNLGPATGCSGNLVWPDYENCRIAESGLGKVEEAVVKEGHVGPIDLNVVVNDEGVWALEWTPRFGYDSTPTYMFLFNQDIGKFFSDIARGQLEGGVPLAEKFAAGVHFSIPPYPLEPENVGSTEKIRPSIGVPIRGLTEKNAGGLYFYEVMEDDGKLVHSPGVGSLGVAVGVSDCQHTAFDQPYGTLKELKIPELQYRMDLRRVLCNMYDDAEYQDNVSVSLGLIPEVELEESDGNVA